MTHPRPRGFQPLALLLAAFALGGFVATWVATFDVSSALRTSIAAFGLVYGATALLAAVGVWRVRPWAAMAFAAWIVLVSVGVWMPLLLTGLQRTALGFGIAGFVPFLSLLILIHRYIARQVQSLAA
jgi:uncharacterized membrane protein (DUF2068 family)